ncbi:MAG: hypothetical protein K2N34_00935 [Lachnospiraceae bacterium]|nr:hypothetical protein [Lachnospiraceae bacterium]
MCQDIQLLTLYKQHYLDNYRLSLESQYSCLGYYDGMEIKPLNVEKDDTPMSCIWKGTGSAVKALKGGYGVQNIGIFRTVSEMSSKVEESEFPYIIVGFLKIEDFTKYCELEKEIANIHAKAEQVLKTRKCNVLTYCTFDSADLVVVARGNSILLLKYLYEKIENIPEVQYLHTIMGFDSGYLDYIRDNPRDFAFWRNQNCHISERIKAIQLNLVTSGNYGVVDRFKDSMKACNIKWGLKGYSKDKKTAVGCSYIMGHANIGIKLSDTDVRSLLVMLVSGGLLTHQNKIYGKGLYNIESFIEFESGSHANGSVKTMKHDSSWCVDTIEHYVEKLDKIAKTDQGLYSYFQALLHTLNTLAQYERFCSSKEVFNLIIPSFQLFDKQLMNVLDSNIEIDEAMKDVICRYLEYVNSVLYHTVHTNQVYLMIPGYSGTAFAIPIKLNLLYAWYVEKVKDMLNDSSRKYAFILIPVMETRPETREISVKLKEQERLICIKISQRILSYPQNLMIVLAHELGHYIGSTIRRRKDRMIYLTKTLGHYLAEGICIYEQNETTDYSETMIKLNDSIRDELAQKITYNIQKGVNKSKQDSNYYLDDIKKMLIHICKQVLDDRGDGAEVWEAIHKVPESISNWAVAEPYDEMQRWHEVYRTQERLDFNRRLLCLSGSIEVIVNALIKIYGEVYSDMTALALLDCTREAFEESFYISDGKKNLIESRERRLRMKIADVVVFSGAERGKKGEVYKAERGKKGEVLSNKFGQGMRNLVDKVYDYIWVELFLSCYAQECYNGLKKLINGKGAESREIREMYQLFASKDKDCDVIYAQIVNKIAEYNKQIEKKYRQYD